MCLKHNYLLFIDVIILFHFNSFHRITSHFLLIASHLISLPSLIATNRFNPYLRHSLPYRGNSFPVHVTSLLPYSFQFNSLSNLLNSIPFLSIPCHISSIQIGSVPYPLISSQFCSFPSLLTAFPFLFNVPLVEFVI